ncbi:hypothetical protein PNQ92_13125 [Halobacterium salinarum]|uniref:hypothetical protein n=1 Tax=Halobacterium salinarum TaxID=2242 RepID=UPI0025572387|nr:hypothetical protein [Halobacterium salinarum]MDL0126343.1 hypothetical protein [Halobacterium salinarum]
MLEETGGDRRGEGTAASATTGTATTTADAGAGVVGGGDGEKGAWGVVALEEGSVWMRSVEGSV